MATLRPPRKASAGDDGAAEGGLYFEQRAVVDQQVEHRTDGVRTSGVGRNEAEHLTEPSRADVPRGPGGEELPRR